MRPEPFLSSQAQTRSCAAGVMVQDPDALAGRMLEAAQEIVGAHCRAAYVLHDRIHPESGEGLETLAMGATSAVEAPGPEHVDRARIGTLVIETGTSGATKARITAPRPFHRDQAIHLVYDLGDAVLSKAQAEMLATRSITFLCNALASFAIIDDITERTWCVALNGLTTDDLLLVRTLVSQRCFGLQDLAIALGQTQKTLKSQIRQIALRDILSPSDTENLLYLIQKYGFLRGFMPAGPAPAPPQ